MDERRQPRDLELLADLLWAERHVVELLLFKLVTAKLILAADERRFVARALDEVERAVERLREAEAARAATLAGIADAWGIPLDDLTLSELAARVPEPMASVLRDHQQAFLDMAGEIEETATVNRRLASAALTSVRETLDALTGPEPGPTYTASGRPTTALTAASRLDEVL